MKLTLTAIAVSTGLMLSPAMANEPETAPRSIKVESDDSVRTTNDESATHIANARERQRMAQPLEEMPKELERRYKNK